MYVKILYTNIRLIISACNLFFYFAANCSRPGYFGVSCDIPCTPGTFGRHCAGSCSGLCPFEICHNVFGCQTNSSIVPQTTDSGLLKIILLASKLYDLKVFINVGGHSCDVTHGSDFSTIASPIKI